MVDAASAIIITSLSTSAVASARHIYTAQEPTGRAQVYLEWTDRSTDRGLHPYQTGTVAA